jgi:hypothetical protein
MEKAKMAKSNFNAGNSIRKAMTEILNDLKGIAGEINMFKAMLQELQQDLASGKLIENAKRCKAENKTTSKACYELIYGEIKEAPAKGGDDQGGVCKGKCSIF